MRYEGHVRARDADDLVHAAVIHGDKTVGREIVLNGNGCFGTGDPGRLIIVEPTTPLTCLVCIACGA